MYSEKDILKDLLKRTDRQIKAFQRRQQLSADEDIRRQRRQAVPEGDRPFKEPLLWQKGKLYNPYFVRSRSRQLAHSVAARIEKCEYKPASPVQFEIPKGGGGQRQVSAFNIVDETISHRLLKSITAKNLQRLGARSYAYLPDRGPYDALANIKYAWQNSDRLYIAEFDFRDYFSSLEHDRLVASLKKAELLLTRTEELLITRFLDAMKDAGISGLSQGSSLSVLLANIAGLELDRGLEKLGAGYARYADDTLIWSDSYSDIARAAQLLHAEAHRIGTSVNHSKSPGIRLLVNADEQAAELSSTTSVQFLGHSIGIDSVQMNDRAERRIESVLSEIIFSCLLREPLRGNQNLKRFTTVDRDYVSCIWRLRKYIYGQFSEGELRQLGLSDLPFRKLEGVVAYYALADDEGQWKRLDNWLGIHLLLALKKRYRLIGDLPSDVTPYSIVMAGDLNALRRLTHRSSTTDQVIDLRIPSFKRMNRLVGAAVRQHGFSVTPANAAQYLYRLGS